MATYMNTISVLFKVGDQVMIEPLQAEGVVTGIWIDGGPPQYKIRYIYNADIIFNDFYGSELRLMEK